MDEEEVSFEYEYLGKCQYPVGSLYVLGPDLATDCGEPAIARAWWRDYDEDSMLLCLDHLEIVKRKEKEIADA